MSRTHQEITNKTGVLTTQDIKFLRSADVVAFHNRPGDDLAAEVWAPSYVRADKYVWGKLNGERVIGEEISLRLACQIQIRGKHADGTPANPKNSRCFEMIHSAKYSEAWRTITALLRARDTITLKWWVDEFANGYVTRSEVVKTDERAGNAGLGMGLHADSLTLVINRAGKEKYTFLVDVSVCVDNSARMIQRHVPGSK